MTKPDTTANERKRRQRDKIRKWLMNNYKVATADALVMLLMKNGNHISKARVSKILNGQKRGDEGKATK